jgi:hypothetical protein
LGKKYILATTEHDRRARVPFRRSLSSPMEKS